MAELAQTEVYPPKTFTIWRVLVSWLAFFFHMFLQILRGTPSMAQVLSFVGLRHPLLSSSSSSSPSFKPLPVVEIALKDTPYLPTPPHLTRNVEHDVNVHHGIDKLTVVLDLDETLVCAYETSSLPNILRIQATEAGLKWFELECVSSEKEYDGKPKVNHVTVFERPGLREFLKQTSEFADLVLFTAGLEGYARPLVDRIDGDNRIGLCLYRPSTISTWEPNEARRRKKKEDAESQWHLSCIHTLARTSNRQYREHVKDLSCLSKNLCRTVIIDNNPFSFLLQPVNGIPCIPFSAGQPYDEQLLGVLLPLLKNLSLQKDVRPVLYERFHMPEWFQKHGIPSSDWT